MNIESRTGAGLYSGVHHYVVATTADSYCMLQKKKKTYFVIVRPEKLQIEILFMKLDVCPTSAYKY